MGNLIASDYCALTSCKSEEGVAIDGADDIVRMTCGYLNKPVKVYPRGVMVGCTFVTRDAIREIQRKLEIGR